MWHKERSMGQGTSLSCIRASSRCGSPGADGAWHTRQHHSRPVTIRSLLGAAPSPRAYIAYATLSTSAAGSDLGDHVWAPGNLLLGQDTATAKHVGSPEWGHGLGASSRLAQGSSHPKFATGAVLLGRASHSPLLREHWQLTSQHF